MDTAEKIMRTLGPGESVRDTTAEVTIEFAGRKHNVQACIGMLGKDMVLLIGDPKQNVTPDFVVKRLLRCACASAISKSKPGMSPSQILGAIAHELVDAFVFMQRHRSARPKPQ